MRFPSPRHEAAIRSLQVADLIKRRMAAVIEPFGVTLQQFNVLRILRGAGEPLPILVIAERMLEQTPGITRLLDRLEAKNLIIRNRSTADKRVYLCSITERGLELLAAMDRPVYEIDETAIGPLSSDDVDQLVRLFRAILAH